MAAALEVAEQGMTAGELPIAAVVVLGTEVIGSAYTQDRSLGRKIVHADLLAMIYALESRLTAEARSPRAGRLIPRCRGSRHRR